MNAIRLGERHLPDEHARVGPGATKVTERVAVLATMARFESWWLRSKTSFAVAKERFWNVHRG